MKRKNMKIHHSRVDSLCHEPMVLLPGFHYSVTKMIPASNHTESPDDLIKARIGVKINYEQMLAIKILKIMLHIMFTDLASNNHDKTNTYDVNIVLPRSE
jgi:hypothetical protein